MKRVLYVIAAVCCLLGCQKSDYVYGETPQSTLDALWELIDQRYCFLTYKEKELDINWQQIHAKYSSKLNPKMSRVQLFEVLCQMISELKDGHVNISTSLDLGRNWSWNGMVGARLTWNIGALYTHHNDKVKVQLQRETAQNQREVFLFNNRLEQMQQNEAIERYRSLMSQDQEIITLREQVRKAAESKLSHGIIDVNDLLRDINSENAARVQRSIHEIEMLKQMYDLKYTTNN